MAQPFVPGAAPIWIGFGKKAPVKPADPDPFPFRDGVVGGVALLGGGGGKNGGEGNGGFGLTTVVEAPIKLNVDNNKPPGGAVDRGLQTELGGDERRLRVGDIKFPPRGDEIAFLGFTAAGVDLDVNAEYSPIVTDVGGGATSLIYRGSSATVTMDLTRWREDTYSALCDHAARNAAHRAIQRRGRTQSGRVGTIMDMEGAAVTLYVAFPYAGKPAYRSMPAGYRFPLAVLDRESLPKRGSRPARLLLIFRCLRALDPQVMATNQWPADDGDLYVLYDADMTALAGRLPD